MNISFCDSSLTPGHRVAQSIQHHLEQWRVRSFDGAEDAPPPPSPSLLQSYSSTDVSTSSSESQLRRGVPNDDISDVAAAEAADVQRTHLLVKHLTQEIDRLGEQQERYRRECEEQRHNNEQLQQELHRLQVDNAGLTHRVLREREIRELVIGEKARLETELELDSERAFNTSSASGTSLLTSARSSATASPALNPYAPAVLMSPKPLAEAFAASKAQATPLPGSMGLPLHSPSPICSPRGT